MDFSYGNTIEVYVKYATSWASREWESHWQETVLSALGAVA
jgi:hypothetical protein